MKVKCALCSEGPTKEDILVIGKVEGFGVHDSCAQKAIEEANVALSHRGKVERTRDARLNLLEAQRNLANASSA